MRAATVLAVASAALWATVGAQSCPAVGPLPTPTPTPTPFTARVNPTLLCPNPCYGWGAYAAGLASYVYLCVCLI